MAETEVIRTPDQRLRVFVSSTLQELAPERQAVRDAVTRLRLVPVLFELGARPQPPRQVYRAYLAQSQPGLRGRVLAELRLDRPRSADVVAGGRVSGCRAEASSAGSTGWRSSMTICGPRCPGSWTATSSRRCDCSRSRGDSGGSTATRLSWSASRRNSRPATSICRPASILRSRLGDAAFAKAWAWGGSIGGRNAVDYALETG